MIQNATAFSKLDAMVVHVQCQVAEFTRYNLCPNYKGGVSKFHVILSYRKMLYRVHWPYHGENLKTYCFKNVFKILVSNVIASLKLHNHSMKTFTDRLIYVNKF